MYLDHAATTPVASEVLGAMLPHLHEGFGNPSSLHAAGRAARVAVDDARARVAGALGCLPREVVFTAGGSEADNLALRGVLGRRTLPGRHLVVSAVEHDAVLKTAEHLAETGRAELTVVGCDRRGLIDPEAVADAVRPGTALVSVMLANNEVGTVQDVAAVAELVRARNPKTVVHTDAVQALGKIPVSVDALGVDLLSVSAHKVYGPKGVGALWVRRGVVIDPQVTGGGQERARRSGTEDVAGIAGFGAAASLVATELEREAPRVGALAERLVAAVVAQLPDAVITGAGAPRLPGFATFAFPGIETELLLTVLDGEGVQCSGGSACSSGAHMPSHVLVAMGLAPQVCAGALRCTLGRGTTAEEVDRAAAAVVAAVRQLRAALPAQEARAGTG